MLIGSRRSTTKTIRGTSMSWKKRSLRGAAAPPVAVAPLMTAAELHEAETAEAPRVSPDVFHQGMVVRHPEYGLGKVVALSGGGLKRSATVAFASTAGQKKFMLAQSDLRPAKSV